MIKIINFLVCIFFGVSLIGQDLQFKSWSGTEYDSTATSFPTNGVADDFGPRRNGKYNWHGGVDYNSEQDDNNEDKWDMILAPMDGEIVSVNRLVTTFQYKHKV